MMDTKQLTEDLRQDEGEVLWGYQDSNGYLTIGVGILIDRRRGGGITKEESAYLLSNRIASKLEELQRRLPWFKDLDSVRQGALINMAFQMGVDGLLGFKNSLEMIRTRRWQEAGENLKQSKWFREDSPARAGRVIKQIVEGKYR